MGYRAYPQWLDIISLYVMYFVVVLLSGASANVTSASGKTALGAAAHHGDVEILKLLLDNDYSSSSDRMKWNKSPAGMPSNRPSPHQGYVYHQGRQEFLAPETCGSLQEYPGVMTSPMQGPGYVYPFGIDYSQQNQGYYVFIHEDNSPGLSPEGGWTPGGGEGLEWDEEVGGGEGGGDAGEPVSSTEDDSWAALYK